MLRRARYSCLLCPNISLFSELQECELENMIRVEKDVYKANECGSFVECEKTSESDGGLFCRV